MSEQYRDLRTSRDMLPPAPPPPGMYYTPPKTNGLGVASMVLGILGWLYLIPAILAVIFGHVALNQIKKNPQQYSGGRGMAIAGLWLGYIWLAIFVVVLAVTVSEAGSSY